MMHPLNKRLGRLEGQLLPSQPSRCLLTFASQHGLHGETIRAETKEQAITRHLTTHPEDAGRAFKVITAIFVAPDGGRHAQH